MFDFKELMEALFDDICKPDENIKLVSFCRL